MVGVREAARSLQRPPEKIFSAQLKTSDAVIFFGRANIRPISRLIDVCPPSAQKLRRGHLQSLGYFLQDENGRIPNAAFDPTDVGPVQLAIECEIFLGKSALLTEFPDVFADPLPHVHVAREPV